jgi:hypothetical protein
MRMSSMDMPADLPRGRAQQRERAAAAQPRAAAAAPRLSWLTLALMTTSSVASLRAAPTMAVYGLACVFLYIVPAIVFLLPTALVSAELASGWPGGVYRWVSEGLSKPLGFLAVWCQFAMTIFYYPTSTTRACWRSWRAHWRTSSTRDWRRTASTQRS